MTGQRIVIGATPFGKVPQPKALHWELIQELNMKLQAVFTIYYLMKLYPKLCTLIWQKLVAIL